VTKLTYPRSPADLKKMFASEESCRDFLFELRWPAGFRCPKCRSTRAWQIRERLYECSVCGTQTSVISGTIFQNTRTPLPLWFRAIWWMIAQSNGATASGLQRAVGLKNYETAWAWLQKLRRVMSPLDWDMLRGVVEVGVCQPGLTERSSSYPLVAIALQIDEGDIGQIRVQRVPDSSAAAVTAFVRKTVRRGSLIVTPQLFPALDLRGLGYIQERAAHSISGEGSNLIRVRSVCGELITWLAGERCRPNSHLKSCLDEFAFRFNTPKSNSRGEIFVDFLRRAVTIEPLNHA
jgi:hypothetical protein